MGLTRLREKMRDVALSVARYIVPISPNILTLSGVIFSILTPIVTWISRNSLLAGMLASISFLMDALDGSVARLRSEEGKSGAFLDSVADRVSDAAVISAFYFLGYSFLLVYMIAILSLIISYIRARAESLGITDIKEVGFMTREFRSISFIVVFIAHHFLGTDITSYFLMLLLLVLGITAIQRWIYTYRMLRS